MRKVIIMRGIPGAGKSTHANDNYPNAAVVSADDYHMIDSEYRFNQVNVKVAHDDCLRRFVELLQGTKRDIIVDNTNIQAWEIAVYYRLAELYKAHVEIVRVEVNPYVAARRSVHKVPLKVVLRMSTALRNEHLPPWWREIVISEGGV